MKRILFISALSIISLVLLIIVVAGIFLSTLDLNDYKDRVEKAIKKSTGRHVVFEGEFTHSFFPLGLKTGPAYIQDEDIYGSEPLLFVNDIALKANIIALMHGDIVIDELSLKGLTAKLAVSSTGKKNWETTNQKIHTANVTPLADENDLSTSPSEDITNISGGIVKKKRFGLYIKSIHADDAKIIYKNLQNNTAWEFEKATTLITNFGENKEMGLEISGDLIVNRHPARAYLSATAQISADNTMQIALSSLKISNKESSGKLPEFSTSASLFYDANLKNLSINDFEGEFNGMTFSGVFAIMLPGSPNLEKNLEWDIRGEAHLGSFYAEDMKEKLTVLGVISPQKRASQENSSVTVTSNYTQTPSLQKEEHVEELASPLPDKGLQFLSHAFMAIDTTVERIAFKEAVLEKIAAKPLLSKSSFNMPYSFSSFGGTVEGVVSAEFTKKEPSWHLTTKAKELKAEFLPLKIAKEKRVTGVITAQADIKGKGIPETKTFSSLNGETSFSMTRGKVKHGNIIPAELRQLYTIPEEYPVENASFSSNIKNGVATTSDMKLVSPLLNATGKGNVDLTNEALHLDIDIMAKEAPLLPLLVRGTLSNPTYTLDLETLARDAAVKKATTKITEKAENLEKKLEQKLEKKLGKKLNDSAKPKKLLQNILKKL